MNVQSIPASMMVDASMRSMVIDVTVNQDIGVGSVRKISTSVPPILVSIMEFVLI